MGTRGGGVKPEGNRADRMPLKTNPPLTHAGILLIPDPHPMLFHSYIPHEEDEHRQLRKSSKAPGQTFAQGRHRPGDNQLDLQQELDKFHIITSPDIIILWWLVYHFNKCFFITFHTEVFCIFSI